MARLAIVIGNGLGMAIDSEYFSLSRGLASIWSGTLSFSEEQKRLVISAIPGLSPADYPSSEEQLDTLQVAIVAAGFLKSFETKDIKWLSKASRKLPQAFRSFVHEVGAYFHKSGKTLPDKFAEGIAQFVNETKSHVATLNYDNLLYDAFVRLKVLDGYCGPLIDGFWKNGFDKEHLDRKDESRHGWYLHLHGSPLYIGNKKLMRDDRQKLEPTEKSHIVLTHVEHKPLIIESSSILSEYWKRFDEALGEADKIVLFGYSGCDTHLNEAIRARCQARPVHVIEWKGGRERSSRQKYWDEKLKDCQVTICQVSNVLEFDAWKSL